MGGGGGKKGGGGGKRPLKDKIEFENHLKKDDDEDDSSTETSFELEVTPEQLVSVNPNRPILRLRLSPRKRVAMASPGAGGSPPQKALLRHSHQKDQVVEDLYNPWEVVKDHHSSQKVLVVGAHHGLQKAVEGH